MPYEFEHYMEKRCKFNPRIRCFWSSCSHLDSYERVGLCRYNRGSGRLFTPKTERIVSVFGSCPK